MLTRRTAPAALVALSLVACGGGGGDDAGQGGSGGMGGSAGAAGSAPTTVPVLGNGTHSLDAVHLTVIATADDGLDVPRDLAFNPVEANQLWIVNRGGPSVTIVFDPAAPDPETTIRSGLGGTHFMAEPSSLAFGAPGWLATSQEQDQLTQPNTPADFMGPTLWTADIGTFNAGHASHYDMLHNSPNSAGIAWERDHVYWVFDGYHASLTRYDFGLDHGAGGEDHSDGIVARYVEGQVAYVPDVPSHMELDQQSGLLYVADTGNARIAALDIASGTEGAPIFPNYDDSQQYEVVGASVSTFATEALVAPSGLALRDGLVFVSDNQSGKVLAYDSTGALVDWLETDVAPGGLMGLAFDADGRLYVADAIGARVLRIEQQPAM